MIENTKRKEQKCKLYRQVKIRCYQKKKDYFIYEMFYMNLIVAPKRKLDQRHEI